MLETALGTPFRSALMRWDAKKEEDFLRYLAKQTFAKVLDIPRAKKEIGPTEIVDTFFILGSGSSIESLEPRHFLEIANQRSVGINNWLVHPFVPDLLSFESVPSVGDGGDFGRALRLLERPDVQVVLPKILILRPRTEPEMAQLALIPRVLQSQTFIYGRLSPATRVDSNLPADFQIFFDKVSKNSQNLVLDSGASVVRMTTFALLLGFRRIVLCGVDLVGSKYFWEKNPAYLDQIFSPWPVNNQKSSQHETLGTTTRPFAVDQMLFGLAQYLRSRGGAQIYVSSRASALSSFLPVYPWGGQRG